MHSSLKCYSPIRDTHWTAKSRLTIRPPQSHGPAGTICQHNFSQSQSLSKWTSTNIYLVDRKNGRWKLKITSPSAFNVQPTPPATSGAASPGRTLIETNPSLPSAESRQPIEAMERSNLFKLLPSLDFLANSAATMLHRKARAGKEEGSDFPSLHRRWRRRGADDKVSRQYKHSMHHSSALTNGMNQCERNSLRAWSKQMGGRLFCFNL